MRVTEVGGKASGLDALLEHGFPVPDAVVITAGSYRRAVAHGDLYVRLATLLESPLPAPDAIEAETRRIEELFIAASLPGEVEEAIEKAATDLLASGPIAVRSSALSEDLASASFAGQYLTVLEVDSVEATIEAVKRCWASLWAPSVRAYRQREHIDEAEQVMAVVLQSMVPAEWAGVLFTRDPLGDEGHIRIEAVRGLGEALVSGRVTPDDVLVSRENLAPVAGATGLPFTEDLARIGMRIERSLGGPQDVEWAYADERLLILQSRPVTTLGTRRDDDGFDTAPETGSTYTPVGVAEMLPGILTPLLWTINAPMLDNAFRRLFGNLGIPAPRTAGSLLALGRFRGRVALNLSILRQAASAMPGGSAAEVDRQYLGRALDEVEADTPPPSGGRFKRMRAGLSAVRVRRAVEDDARLFADATTLLLSLRVDATTLRVERLLNYWARVRDLAWRGYATEVAASAGAAAAYRALEMALEKWIGAEKAALWAQRITTGPPVTDQSGCNYAAEVWGLYAGPFHGEAVEEALRAGPVEGASARLAALGGEGEDFLEAVAGTARHFGSKAVYGGPTWDEDTEVLWSCIASMAAAVDERGVDMAQRASIVREEREAALGELQAALKKGWRWRLTRIMTGQIVDVRARMLRRLATDASDMLAMRERTKSALLILGGEERRLIQEAARRLVASGHLRHPDDVELLTTTELETMLLGVTAVGEEEVARRRQALEIERTSAALPEHFEGIPGVETFELPPGGRLDGWAASPGAVRGVARILEDVADGASLGPGDILVARSTDPSWTPLFLVAGGIVLEEGGPLSHAAIVAREFGVPAVLNVKGATSLISDGDEIAVDGTAGIVATASKAA